MSWMFWVFMGISFFTGLLLGLLADGYKYNTGRKYGLQDKEEELMPIIGRLQEELWEEREKKAVINGKYKVREEE